MFMWMSMSSSSFFLFTYSTQGEYSTQIELQDSDFYLFKIKFFLNL